MSVDGDQAHNMIREAITRSRSELLDLSHAIHAEPELAFAEHRSASRVADFLEERGFRTRRGVYGLETAVEAVYGSGEFVVALCAEYDALPRVGHGCGHNIIAASAVGAAVGLATLTKRLDLTIKVLGTPAEESGGGKALMLERGAWDDVTISLMAHPSATDRRTGGVRSRAVDRFRITYRGQAAHSSQSPHAGVNALDAAVVAITAIGLLRQQLHGDSRVAAIVSQGGEATNVIPGLVSVDCEVREFTLERLASLKRRVLACFEAGAIATGCHWSETSTEPVYEELLQDEVLAESFDRNLVRLGRTPVDLPDPPIGSTDMGNVTRRVPGIHPQVAIRDADCATHTAEFAAAARSEEGDRTAIDAALALAHTVADVAMDPVARTHYLRMQSERPTR